MYQKQHTPDAFRQVYAVFSKYLFSCDKDNILFLICKKYSAQGK